MSHKTCFTVRVEAWDRGRWSAYTADKRIGPIRTSEHPTPQEALLELTGVLSEVAINQSFSKSFERDECRTKNCAKNRRATLSIANGGYPGEETARPVLASKLVPGDIISFGHAENEDLIVTSQPCGTDFITTVGLKTGGEHIIQHGVRVYVRTPAQSRNK